jgi:DNA-binding transcriptional LysR family regulator
MRPILALLVALFAFVSLPAVAGAMGEQDEAAIRETITRQLEAFKRDDGAEAYSHAAPNVKQVFPSVDMFMTMVKNGYGPVYRPKEYSFKDLSVNAGRLEQRVEILGPDNDFWMAVYSVERQTDGTWKITGCYLIKTPAAAT